MCLISLKFRGFLWSLVVPFQIVRSFVGFYQNYMAFWSLNLSFSVEKMQLTILKEPERGLGIGKFFDIFRPNLLSHTQL